MYNTSENIDKTTKVKTLGEYMKYLKLSGYDESERLNPISVGVEGDIQV